MATGLAHIPKMRILGRVLIYGLLCVLALLLAGCGLLATAAPQTATVMVTFDLGGGGSGFAATIYAQEVSSGKTFKEFYPAGSHGGVVLPTSPPISVTVDAPGTYVFYARLINLPDEYHFGATGCPAGTDCASSVLKALDVQPGGIYKVVIADRKALLPKVDQPVDVSWER